MSILVSILVKYRNYEKSRLLQKEFVDNSPNQSDVMNFIVPIAIMLADAVLSIVRLTFFTLRTQLKLAQFMIQLVDSMNWSQFSFLWFNQSEANIKECFPTHLNSRVIFSSFQQYIYLYNRILILFQIVYFLFRSNHFNLPNNSQVWKEKTNIFLWRRLSWVVQSDCWIPMFIAFTETKIKPEKRR